MSEIDELDQLKGHADALDIKYHTSIGIEKLKDKIAEADATPNSVPAVEESSQQKLIRIKKEANRLIRVRVTCMNSNKSEWEGEMFSVGNNLVGTVKKYVPFNVEYHVPQFILNMINGRKYQSFYTVTDSKTGQKTRKGKLVKEFSVEMLPSLTQKELNDLAQRQAMANGTSD